MSSIFELFSMLIAAVEVESRYFFITPSGMPLDL